MQAQTGHHGGENHWPGEGFRTVSARRSTAFVTRVTGNVFLTIEQVAGFRAANGT